MKRRAFFGVILGALATKTPARGATLTVRKPMRYEAPAPLALAFHKDAYKVAFRLVTSYEARYDTRAERFITRCDVMATWPPVPPQTVVIYG